MMYALNREVEYFDMPEVREIVREAAANNYTFADIITGIVNSDAFRRQGPESIRKRKRRRPRRRQSDIAPPTPRQR